ncbi:MAG: hypothetical protein P8Z71_07430 [Candidatus Sulfobium sp.]
MLKVRTGFPDDVNLTTGEKVPVRERTLFPISGGCPDGENLTMA